MGPYVAVYLVVAFIFAFFGRWVAYQCGRESIEGFVLGLLFGPLGVIVEALLPKFPSDMQVRRALNEAIVRGDR
jgi:hypothetical protein